MDDPELRRQLLDIATHDVRRIDRLVTEISDASRIDAEMSRTEFDQLDLSVLLHNVVASREERGENKGRRIVIESGYGPFTMMGVGMRLERVIENLLDNAVSFSPPEGTILATLERSDSQLILSINDEGPGIPEAKREKVFHRFHSDRPDGEDFGNHSGLGLAIGRTIAEAHEGSLRAAARLDGRDGARMILTLPAMR